MMIRDRYTSFDVDSNADEQDKPKCLPLMGEQTCLYERVLPQALLNLLAPGRLGIMNLCEKLGCLLAFVDLGEATSRIEVHRDQPSASDGSSSTTAAFPQPNLCLLEFSAREPRRVITMPPSAWKKFAGSRAWSIMYSCVDLGTILALWDLSGNAFGMCLGLQDSRLGYAVTTPEVHFSHPRHAGSVEDMGIRVPSDLISFIEVRRVLILSDSPERDPRILSVTSVGSGLEPKAQSNQTAQKQSEFEQINQDEFRFGWLIVSSVIPSPSFGDALYLSGELERSPADNIAASSSFLVGSSMGARFCGVSRSLMVEACPVTLTQQGLARGRPEEVRRGSLKGAGDSDLSVVAEAGVLSAGFADVMGLGFSAPVVVATSREDLADTGVHDSWSYTRLIAGGEKGLPDGGVFDVLGGPRANSPARAGLNLSAILFDIGLVCTWGLEDSCCNRLGSSCAAGLVGSRVSGLGSSFVSGPGLSSVLGADSAGSSSATEDGFDSMEARLSSAFSVTLLLFSGTGALGFPLRFLWNDRASGVMSRCDFAGAGMLSVLFDRPSCFRTESASGTDEGAGETFGSGAGFSAAALVISSFFFNKLSLSSSRRSVFCGPALRDRPALPRRMLFFSSSGATYFSPERKSVFGVVSCFNSGDLNSPDLNSGDFKLLLCELRGDVFSLLLSV
ncbi:hypothetical protein KCU81_g228, partial [Aureobasidium melanogenum]